MVDNNLKDKLRISDIEVPYVIKDVVIIQPGLHTPMDCPSPVRFTPELVRKTFNEVDWNNDKLTSIYVGHKDNFEVDPDDPSKRRLIEVGANVDNYIGNYVNIRLDDDKVIGDMEIVKPLLVPVFAYKRAKFATSPAGGMHFDGNSDVPDYLTIRNFSVVVNPGMHGNEIPKRCGANGKQVGCYNFAMSSLPQDNTNQSNQSNQPNLNNNMDVNNMDKEEMKEILNESMKPVFEETKAMRSDIETIRREQSDLVKQVSSISSDKTPDKTIADNKDDKGKPDKVNVDTSANKNDKKDIIMVKTKAEKEAILKLRDSGASRDEMREALMSMRDDASEERVKKLEAKIDEINKKKEDTNTTPSNTDNTTSDDKNKNIGTADNGNQDNTTPDNQIPEPKKVVQNNDNRPPAGADGEITDTDVEMVEFLRTLGVGF